MMITKSLSLSLKGSLLTIIYPIHFRSFDDGLQFNIYIYRVCVVPIYLPKHVKTTSKQINRFFFVVIISFGFRQCVNDIDIYQL